jgi:hypothetical protein
MKLKRPILSQPQPSFAQYFGNAEENLSQYFSMFQAFHMEVDDTLEEETNGVAWMVVGHGQEHGHTRILTGVRKTKNILTQIKDTLTTDSPPYRAS